MSSLSSVRPTLEYTRSLVVVILGSSADEIGTTQAAIVSAASPSLARIGIGPRLPLSRPVETTSPLLSTFYRTREKFKREASPCSRIHHTRRAFQNFSV